MQLTKSFTAEQYADAFESWGWLDIAGKEPVLSSLFGHTFLRSAEGLWFLDVIAGSLRLQWPDADALRADLQSSEGQRQLLLAGLASAAAARGMALSETQVFDFTKPPVLGGYLEVANLSAMDFVVAVNIAGQIHEQVRDRPVGSPVESVTMQDSEPRKSRWRRSR